ncbi:hypothetical protein OB919_17250 [Halobacteria archaeon AArc-curdl1]|uniref:Uncharacterized protein n=1 Tax=Natronosalvus hydrolyticus TaxID=2979988 RepID=A0AAP2ZAJ3_9EURY|nr:hypothetical protein [Halobacteria archaeon AArc-curdl1]
MAEDTNADEPVESKSAPDQDPEPATPVAEDDSDSVVDLAQQPIVVDWIKYVTALFAFVGIGYGVFGILADVIDEGIIESDGFGGLAAAVSFPVMSTPYIAITAAVFVGAFLGWKLHEDDTTTFLAAGLSVLVGTLVFWLLAAILGTIPIDDVSLDFGGLILNAIVAGIGAAITAVGGVWSTRNLAPVTLDSSAGVSTESGVAPADD